MMVMEWLDTAWRVVLGGFLALLPGLIFWLVVLVLFLLVRWLALRVPDHGLRGRIDSAQ
jgi:hypothetical protein